MKILWVSIVMLGLCTIGVPIAGTMRVGATTPNVESSETEGFTAVAGTDNVVTDRRAKNNSVLLSGFVLTILFLLVVGALRHATARQSDKNSN
jgi:hypothetical protein